MTWTTKQSIVLAFVLALTVSFNFSIVRLVQAAPATGQESEARLAAIESINVDGEGDATELVIKLSSPATYTSYKTTAPLRLVVDLSQVTPGTITVPLVINKGNFKTVTVSRYDTGAGVLTRVDIELVKDAEAVISSTPNQKGELRVSFPAPPAQITTAAITPPAQESEEPATVKKDVSTANVAPAEVTLAPSESASPAPVAPVSPANDVEVKKIANPEVVPSRLLTGISASNNLIELSIAGGVGEFKTFRLNKPERLVIDLFGVNSGLPNRIVPINAAGVASARLGLYPDKVRVVFDAVNGTFPETDVTKSEKGITVALNVKAAIENPNTRLVAARSQKSTETSPAAEAKPAEHHAETENVTEPAIVQPLPKPVVKAAEHRIGPATVEMIDFQVIEGISRVSVKVAGDSVVEPPVSTPGFVTFTIKNTLLPKRLQRSLETKGFISPVLRVTPILVKTSKGTDTKIRIALRAVVTPEFKHEGDMLFIDFKNPEGITAEKAPAEIVESRPQTAYVAKASSKANELSDELSPSSESVAAKKYKGRKVTLEFADADVRKIFQLLAEVSNKNFVLGDDVSGTISIRLVNVPWDQALDIILDAKGLDKREEGNIIIIKGKGKFKSQAEEEQEIKRQLFKSIELKTETFTINYADIGSIVAQFTALKSERGTIAQDSRTNKVIVKDIPQALDDMRKLLQQLDVPERQVMIEARIVEATSTFTRSLGVNWGVHYRDGSASFAGINSLDTGFGGLTSAPPTSGTGLSSGSTMGISFGTLTSNVRLDMRLNAAASAGLIKIVSTPKVATINNKTAKITQGQQIPYTSSTSDKIETKFIEAALSLEVTPHINANGTIGMKIDAKNDSPGSSSGDTAPPINKKQATTEMLLRDGETTVIGGIYVDSDNESDDGVPFLMDIPFIGSLFKTNNKTKTKTELLIFITPRILGTI